MRRRSSPIAAAIFLSLLILGLFLREQRPTEHLYRPEHHPVDTTSAWNAPDRIAETGSLIKYGIPVPHKLVGPYHVLVNQGYVSGYDAGIQDPLWVETRFFAVANPTSAARPEQFSTDERIEPEDQVISCRPTRRSSGPANSDRRVRKGDGHGLKMTTVMQEGLLVGRRMSI